VSVLKVGCGCRGNGKLRRLGESVQTSHGRGGRLRDRLELSQLGLEAAVERLGTRQATAQLVTLGDLSVHLGRQRLDAFSFLAELPLQLRAVLPRLQELRHQPGTLSDQQQRHLGNHNYTGIRPSSSALKN